MGDGGVACMPTPHAHIMDRFSVVEESALCGRGKSLKNIGGGNNGGIYYLSASRKEMMKVLEVKQVVSSMNAVILRNEASLEKETKNGGEADNLSSLKNHERKHDDEIEDGELKCSINPSLPDKPYTSAAEVVDEKGRAEDSTESQHVLSKLRKVETNREETDKVQHIVRRWHETNYSKCGGRHETIAARTPPPTGKFHGGNVHASKEMTKNPTNHYCRNSQRREFDKDEIFRINSKVVKESSSKSDYRGVVIERGEYIPVNKPKRNDCCDYKHYVDFPGSKSRRLCVDSTRSPHSDDFKRHYAHLSYKNVSSSSSSFKISLSDKCASRHYDSSSNPKVVHDRYGCSPVHCQQFPHNKARHLSHKDQSPAHRDRSSKPSEKSPFAQERSPRGHERSPYDHDRSPRDRDRTPYTRDKAKHGYGRSLYGHEESSHLRSLRSDHRNKSPVFSERSSKDLSRCHYNRDHTPIDQLKACQKGGTSDKHFSPRCNKAKVDEASKRVCVSESSGLLGRKSQDTDDLNSIKRYSLNPNQTGEHSPRVDVPPLEQPSMEEDMDICDTPPHVSLVTDTSTGKWFYLDYLGMEHGPSKLCDIRALVDGGVLVSDHLVKQLDSDRWVTIENAVSPLVSTNMSSIASDTITQLVTPPEETGNVLCDIGDSCGAIASNSWDNFHIDERINALMGGFAANPCKQLEILQEALQTTFEPMQLNEQGDLEDSDEFSQNFNGSGMEPVDAMQNVFSGKNLSFCSLGPANQWLPLQWPCKGGDWKRADEAMAEGFSRRKLVLNDGFPLCQMPRSGEEDPRCFRKDDLYCPSSNKKLELPPWAFSCSQEKTECGVPNRPTSSKLSVTRGTKGTVLPVVKTNSRVVRDNGSVVFETQANSRGRDSYIPRSGLIHHATNDGGKSISGSHSQSQAVHDEEELLHMRNPTTPSSTYKDHLFSAHDLQQLHVGEWYYLDGAGREQGPYLFSDLQSFADQGYLMKYCSVFRKLDSLWVPLTSAREDSVAPVKDQEGNAMPNSDLLEALKSQCSYSNEGNISSNLFNSLHPQFIGYTRGKLHELVMKSYKSREFVAALNEVLEQWIHANQPQKSEFDAHVGKRARLQVDENVVDFETEDLQNFVRQGDTFEELCADALFPVRQNMLSENDPGSCWALLDGHLLARIFHFLPSKMESLAFASLTCKHWRAASNFYKDISKEVDLSSVGSKCTDSIVWNIMNHYNKERISCLVLAGCTNVSAGMIEDILRAFPSLSSCDITRCNQLTELAPKFPNINWLKSSSLPTCRISDDSHVKAWNLKRMKEKVLPSNGARSMISGPADFCELKEYFNSANMKDPETQFFRRSLYRRSKLFDARRSSSIVSRDARVRQWAVKKSDFCYKRMEGFLASSLKEILKENTFDFFLPKVAEIENKMKNGYYFEHGLRWVKEDISRICRDAIKAKNRGAGNMNRIISLFIHLASCLDFNSKSSTGLDSVPAKFKKMVTERKSKSRLSRRSLDSEAETSDGKTSGSESSNIQSIESDMESDLDFQLAGKHGDYSEAEYFAAEEGLYAMKDEREWGARMTKESLVPPITRRYEVIDHYVIVADEDDVERKMRVSLPDDYSEKLDAQKSGVEELDMELPEVKEYKPRKQLGDDVIEQEVYGIDPYTYNLVLDSMPCDLDWPLCEKQSFIEDLLLQTINKQVRIFTGTGNTPMMFSLRPVIEEIEKVAELDCDFQKIKICQGILKAMDDRPKDNYVAYRKGLGVVCNKVDGFGEDDFVVEFLGEVYPAWKWFEKQDGIRSLQEDNKDPAPEFYNIYLERPKGDADGYDLVVVDAMHMANYASRICHSCKPNCEAKVTAVGGRYQIGIYTLRGIQCGEEITFDYNSVTESKEEYEASVCLCGNHLCRGSYLNLTGEGAFQKVLKQWHGVLDRHHLMIEACELNCAYEEDYLDLGRAGFGSCLLGGLPDWLIAYAARLVRFINLERTKLPEEILKHNLEEKRKFFLNVSLDVERNDAEVQAEGVYNQRLQNLAVTLDKVRYVMRCIFRDPKIAPPPLERLTVDETVAYLWNGKDSVIDELVRCLTPHLEEEVLDDLVSKIHSRDPSHSNNSQRELHRSLLWLRNELRRLPCTYKCRHDAAADMIHMYAYTKSFFKIKGYSTFTSPSVYISPLDLGPKYAEKLGGGLHEYRKAYGQSYCLGQLIFWHVQTNSHPDRTLDDAIKGCLSLPDMASFYAKIPRPSQQRIYGPKTQKTLLDRLERQQQRAWPKDQIWSFRSFPKVFGSPLMDAVLNSSVVDREMLHWLRNRPLVYQESLRGKVARCGFGVGDRTYSGGFVVARWNLAFTFQWGQFTASGSFISYLLIHYYKIKFFFFIFYFFICTSLEYFNFKDITFTIFIQTTLLSFYLCKLIFLNFIIILSSL